ncbi:MAG: hypothetical protein ACI9X0_001196, partial [Kiritimatiellia bacterium]
EKHPQNDIIFRETTLPAYHLLFTQLAMPDR